MAAITTRRTGLFAWPFVLVMALAGCGGGSNDAAPPAAGQTLGPAAGSVTSSDGKVTVTVGDNALQAATAIAIAPAEPDAATAADRRWCRARRTSTPRPTCRCRSRC